MMRSLLSLFVLVLVTTVTVKAQRDESFPACDTADGSPAAVTATTTSGSGSGVVMTGNAIPWGPHVDFSGSGNHAMGNRRRNEFTTTDPVFFTAPGTGSCGITYTNESVVACLKPGWINSAYKNGCNKWIQAELPSLGTKVTAQVVDACGALPDDQTTFDCGDVYLSLAAYATLARGDQSIIDAGRLPGPVTWSFIKEPCWACEGGLDGKLPNGDVDTCEGTDSWGEPRDGRKTGDDIKTGAAAGEACSAIAPGCQVDYFKQFKLAQDKMTSAGLDYEKRWNGPKGRKASKNGPKGEEVKNPTMRRENVNVRRG